ncbi:MAG: hypothetical protein NVSMB32_17860 [Actinomycetota bacterium]
MVFSPTSASPYTDGPASASGREGWLQGNRRGAQLEVITDATGGPTGYRVYDTAGEHYDYMKH